MLYSSRDYNPGVGFPSCSRALARIPTNTNDCNGYYSDLGLPPWATVTEIRRAVRKRLKLYHPDGAHPDPVRYRHFLIIRDVLLDPVRKAAYDRTGEDEVFIDEEIKEQLLAQGIPQEALTALETEDLDKPVHFDYYALDHTDADQDRAMRWYDSLCSVAPIFGYVEPIAVLIHDGPPAFKREGRVVLVPRDWPATSAVAFALFALLIRPRHAARNRTRVISEV